MESMINGRYFTIRLKNKRKLNVLSNYKSSKIRNNNKVHPENGRDFFVNNILYYILVCT